MGLFSRKDSAPSRKPQGKPRPSVSSEAQAADLRSRARRRLAGSIALILAAVVILPMLLDSEPAPVAGNIPIRIPDRQAPFQPNLSEPEAPAATTGQPPTAIDQVASTPANPSVAATSPPAAATPQAMPDSTQKPNPVAVPVAPKPPTPPAPRRDDGARALALLEGRTPVASAPTPTAPVRGNFVVQAMSLDSASDAQKQRSVLVAAGLSNAFVDGPVTVNGRPKYRVRVGPFQSREAAQAAQTRLRTQGYSGAFITTQ